MALTYLTEENFQKEVEQAGTPVIIDFYADWCMPCRMMGPVFESLSSEYQGKLKFVKLDVESQPMLAEQFSVQGIPTLVIANKGREVERIVGFGPAPVLKTKIDAVLSRIK